ncbi:porin Omp33-36 [Acinetobacter beijerinckii]|uniref:porin Omp33-36 n=1 Tax=Acinetobacter beijerinckii TaxID=262668 RepID=UPI003AF8937F
MKKLGLATALLLAMTGAHAYQVEVQGQSEFLDTTKNDKDFTGAGQVSYFFKDVDTSKGPLAEAAFLNQASNVSVAYSFAKESGDEIVTRKNQSLGAKGEAYIPTPYLPVYTSAAYSHSQTKTDGKKDNGDRFALEVGTMLAPNFLVAVGYTNIADQVALDANSVLSRGIVKTVAESQTIGQDQDAITARTKYVGNIDGTNMAVGFEAGLVYGDDTAFELKTDVYLTPKLSVGASYAESSFTNTSDSAWGANVNYFITPAVAVGASYVNANAVNADLDTQTVGLNAKFRF